MCRAAAQWLSRMKKSFWIATLLISVTVGVLWWVGGVQSQRDLGRARQAERELKSVPKETGVSGPNTVTQPVEPPVERITTTVTPGAVMTTTPAASPGVQVSPSGGAPGGSGTQVAGRTAGVPPGVTVRAPMSAGAQSVAGLVAPPIEHAAAKVHAEEVALNVRQFRLRFGGNPVGTNADIVKELDGGNPKSARYLPSELKRLNASGELIDSWGSPYFFHQLSAQDMEVRSAGPDKVMWSSDDIVEK